MQKRHISKTNALFQNIVLILCLLLACMLAYMTFFMDRYVVQEQVRELDASNLRVLNRTNDSITQTIGDLEQQVQLFLADQTLLQYLLSPYPTGSDESMQILRDLKQYVSLTPDVEQLWLYAPESNTVLSSDGYLITRSGSQAGQLLDQYEQQAVPRSGPDLRLSAVVMDQNLYIVIDFVPASWLGCFMFQMDPQRLGIDAGEGLSRIFVTNANGVLLLDGPALASGSSSLDLTQTQLFYSDPSTRRSGQMQYYQVVNQQLGWHLLMEISDGPGLYNHTIFWLMMLPFLALMLVLGAVGAYFITRKIYAPINRLLTLVMDCSGSPPPTGNDTDYLEAAYQQTIQDNAQLHAQFSALGQDVCQYLCREAIHGQLSEHSDLEGIAGFLPSGLFQAALVQLGKSGVELQPSFKHKLQLSALEGLASQLPECLCCLELERDTILCVLQFPGHSYAPSDAVQLMERFLSQAQEQTQCQLVYGLGDVCPGLHQLKSSYDQAVRDLQYNAYLAADPDPAAARSVQNKLLEERLTQVIDQAVLSQDDVDSQVSRIVQAAEQGAQEDADRRYGYRQAQNLFLEKLLFQTDALQALPNFDPEQPGGQVREEFIAFCRQALTLARAMAGKKKYRYVDEAKKFIQDNYMNCSLSANDISAHIGISPSYFSSLFNELLQESVTSYLNRIRVEQAKSMLTVTRIPIKEIGFRCGFNSANVFGRVFKKYTGQSPKQFREQEGPCQEGDAHE